MVTLRDVVDDEAHARLCQLYEEVEAARRTRDTVSDVVKPHITLRLSIEDVELLLGLVP